MEWVKKVNHSNPDQFEVSIVCKLQSLLPMTVREAIDVASNQTPRAIVVRHHKGSWYLAGVAMINRLIGRNRRYSDSPIHDLDLDLDQEIVCINVPAWLKLKARRALIMKTLKQSGKWFESKELMRVLPEWVGNDHRRIAVTLLELRKEGLVQAEPSDNCLRYAAK